MNPYQQPPQAAQPAIMGRYGFPRDNRVLVKAVIGLFILEAALAAILAGVGALELKALGTQEGVDQRPHGLVGIPEQLAQDVAAQGHGLGAAALLPHALHEHAVYARAAVQVQVGVQRVEVDVDLEGSIDEPSGGVRVRAEDGLIEATVVYTIRDLGERREDLFQAPVPS